MNSSTAVENEDHHSTRLTKDFKQLRQSPLFSGLHLDVVKLIAYLSRHRTFQPGDLLTEHGDKADKAFILNEGCAEVIVMHKGEQVVLQQLENEGFFGELALLAQFDWFFSVKALNVVDALIIDRNAFQKVLEKFPDHRDGIIERVIQTYVSRLVDQTSSMLDKMLPADTIPSTALI
ncbi:MAG: cyclic nucleotide-binding domain-containing protein [Desulfocapsaceae bacterium]